MNDLKCNINHIDENKVNEAIKNKSDEETLIKTADLFKILGSETRLKIVDALKSGELCVCEIALVLNMTQSATSHQLSKLKKYGIVSSRRDGLSIYYYLKDKHIEKIYNTAYTHIINC